MHWTDVLRIAFRMLRTNLLRSLLTTLGIGIAISFIVVLIGLGYGLQSITIGSIVKSKALLSLDITADEREGVVLNGQSIAAISQLEGVAAASPVIVVSGQANVAGQAAAVAVMAGNQRYMEMEGIDMSSGRQFEDGTREIVVSPQLLELLGLQADRVMNTIVSLSYTDPNNENELKQIDNLLVVGISGPTEAPTIFLPYDLIGTTDERTRLTSIKALARNRDDILQVREQATQKGYMVESLVDTLDQARQVFAWVTFGLIVFGGIALVVASIGMFNTLTIALIERTREIGIMKAIGVTNRTVRALFLAEAGLIGFCGGLFGIAIGLAVDQTVEFIINELARNYRAEALNLFQYPAGFLVGIILFPVVLSMLTGLYPAIRAARLNPLRALRYE